MDNNHDAALQFVNDSLIPWINSHPGHPSQGYAAMLTGFAPANELLAKRNPLLNFDLANVTYEGLAYSDGQIEVDSAIYTNQTAVQQTYNFGVTKVITDTFSYSFSEGVKIGVSAKVDVGIAGATVSGEFSFGANQTQTATKTQTWSVAQTVIVPPSPTTRATASMTQRQAHGRFVARYTVSATTAGIAMIKNRLDVVFPGINLQMTATGYVSGISGFDVAVALT